MCPRRGSCAKIRLLGRIAGIPSEVLNSEGLIGLLLSLHARRSLGIGQTLALNYNMYPKIVALDTEYVPSFRHLHAVLSSYLLQLDHLLGLARRQKLGERARCSPTS